MKNEYSHSSHLTVHPLLGQTFSENRDFSPSRMGTTPMSTEAVPSVWDASKTLPGFVAAGIFDEDGLVVDGHSTRPEFNIGLAAGSFIMLLLESNTAGEFMNLGSSKEVQIDYKDMIIILRMIRPAPQALFLGLAAHKGSPLGRIRMAFEQLERSILENHS